MLGPFLDLQDIACSTLPAISTFDDNATGSPAGIDFAARHSDLVFVAPPGGAPMADRGGIPLAITPTGAYRRDGRALGDVAESRFSGVPIPGSPANRLAAQGSTTDSPCDSDDSTWS